MNTLLVFLCPCLVPGCGSMTTQEDTVFCFLSLTFGSPLPDSCLCFLSIQNIPQVEPPLTILAAKTLLCPPPCGLLQAPPGCCPWVSPGPSLHRLNTAATVIPSDLMSDHISPSKELFTVSEKNPRCNDGLGDLTPAFDLCSSPFQVQGPSAILCIQQTGSSYNPLT